MSLEEKAPVILCPGSEEEISGRALLLVSQTTAEVKRSPHAEGLDLMAAPRANTTQSHKLLQRLHRSSTDSVKPEHAERLEASAKDLEAVGCSSEDLAFLHCCGPSGSSSTSLLSFKHTDVDAVWFSIVATVALASRVDEPVLHEARLLYVIPVFSPFEKTGEPHSKQEDGNSPFFPQDGEALPANPPRAQREPRQSHGECVGGAWTS